MPLIAFYYDSTVGLIICTFLKAVEVQSYKSKQFAKKSPFSIPCYSDYQLYQSSDWNQDPIKYSYVEVNIVYRNVKEFSSNICILELYLVSR